MMYVDNVIDGEEKGSGNQDLMFRHSPDAQPSGQCAYSWNAARGVLLRQTCRCQLKVWGKPRIYVSSKPT